MVVQGSNTMRTHAIQSVRFVQSLFPQTQASSNFNAMYEGGIKPKPFGEFFSFRRSYKSSRAAGMTKDGVQLATHKRWDPEDGCAVGVPDVPALVGDGVGPFANVGPSCVGLSAAFAATVVFILVGAEDLTARLARKTLKALNSCPSPVFPSYLCFVQRVPQVVPLWPPEHCFAAPSAELWR